MKLQLLCLTMPTRMEFLKRLYKTLDRQLDHRDSSVLIRMCDPAYTLGENRDMLRRASEGQYICFVDDDDLVPDDYVDTILPLLVRGVDYVGFDVQCYIDGKKLGKLTHHSLRYEGWYEDETGFYRDISHINPIRRDLALLEPMEGGHGEDVRWADRMRARNVLKTERYVGKVLYHYFFRTRKNMGKPCPKCGSTSTVLVGEGTACNGCGEEFDRHPEQKSCLWT